MFKPKPVVFNIFQGATHFETQFNLLTPFQKVPVRHMKCSCVCTIENHDSKITYDITMPNKNSFIKFIHMTASVRETQPCVLQITPQHDLFKTRITPKLAIAIR